VYWAYIVAAIGGSCWMDRCYDAHELFLPMKAYALVFPFGLIDWFFSDNTRMSPRVFLGALLWGSTMWLRIALARKFIGENLTQIVMDFGPMNLAKEMLRFIAAAPICAILSDVIFSPMHRLEHSILYKQHHKEHHIYTNKINSLVLYHGAALDDFMMPATTTFGYFVYWWLCSKMGIASSAFSNMSEWLILFNTLLSHAHDSRCASLILPVPDSLNFAAYHRVHHLNPTRNFGLTIASDLIWDKILGVTTIEMDSVKAEEEGKLLYKMKQK